MALEEDLTAALLESYTRAGREVGYWAGRFLPALKRHGGLKRAQEMLKPRTAGQRKGLDALLRANRPDLTLEAVILRPEFQPLFTSKELAEAKKRLGEYGATAAIHKAQRERLYPDELEPGQEYVEGARKQVRVNAFERNQKARKACIAHYGCTCGACGLKFEERYGEVGKDFIHVHHLKPLALTNSEHLLDPLEDLRPVCPNCHAMLHRNETPLSIEELRERIFKATSS